IYMAYVSNYFKNKVKDFEPALKNCSLELIEKIKEKESNFGYVVFVRDTDDSFTVILENILGSGYLIYTECKETKFLRKDEISAINFQLLRELKEFNLI